MISTHPVPKRWDFLWGASKVTVEGVVSALLISGLFLRGKEKKIPFLEGLEKKGGISKRVEDCVAIFFYLFFGEGGGKSRVNSFIARPGVLKLNRMDMIMYVFFCFF